MTRTLPAIIIPEGRHAGISVPITIILLNISDIRRTGISEEKAIEIVAKNIGSPVGINVFDMDAVTTTSDGIMVEGAIVRMGAGDMGKIHPEFGTLAMAQIQVNRELVEEEPHLEQMFMCFPNRRLLRGPNPADKKVPIHNAVMTGRAVNNNSATEMMNVVTMDEILLPILGQLQIMQGGDVLIGKTGETISVGIGMTVAERFGRVFPTRQFKAGDTAHGSGEYAKTLKSHIPCILSTKEVLAGHIIRALRVGMIPGKHIAISPAVLTTAKYLGYPIAVERISERARDELSYIGFDQEFFDSTPEVMNEAEFIDRADELIPGAEKAIRRKASDLSLKIEIPL